ncbi:MAG: Hsp20/alpha crystallin family protein [Verrucomicrobiota bacterium]
MNFIQRYQPALSWVNEIDRLFDRNVFNPTIATGPREAFQESDNAWILRLDLPGFSKEDITLTVTDRTLQLTGETPPERPFGGKFERQWKLGADIDPAAISARLENGVLELTLGKQSPVIPQATTIEIQ